MNTKRNRIVCETDVENWLAEVAVLVRISCRRLNIGDQHGAAGADFAGGLEEFVHRGRP
jgi:hypothetical protein